jgi:hypothetical protein
MKNRKFSIFIQIIQYGKQTSILMKNSNNKKKNVIKKGRNKIFFLSFWLFIHQLVCLNRLEYDGYHEYDDFHAKIQNKKIKKKKLKKEGKTEKNYLSICLFHCKKINLIFPIT